MISGLRLLPDASLYIYNTLDIPGFWSSVDVLSKDISLWQTDAARIGNRLGPVLASCLIGQHTT